MQELDHIRKIYKEGLWTKAAGDALPKLVFLIEAQNEVIESLVEFLNDNRSNLQRASGAPFDKMRIAWIGVRDVKVP